MKMNELKAKSGKPRAFVEIGHGEMPAFAVFRKIPLVDEVYLGLDINADAWKRLWLEHSIAHGRRQIDMMRASGRSCYWDYIGTDGMIPLENGSAARIIMTMITNDIHIDPATVARLIEESARVLEAGGRLIIVNSPARWRSRERGDIFIDFQDRTFGRYYSGYDRGSMDELEDNLKPCDAEDHMRFLEEYGGNPEFVPGVDFSVFSRIPAL